MKLKKILLTILGILIFSFCLTNVSKATTETLSFSIPVTNDYKAAFDVLKLVNKERAAQGKNELKMDKDLMEAAMVRSAEIVADFSHTRPDGTSCFTAVTKSVGWEGENIAVAYATPTDVMKGWMNSPGHKENILRGEFNTIGIGAIKYGNTYYWTQIFGESNLNEIKTAPANKSITSKVKMKTSNVKLYYNSTSDFQKSYYEKNPYKIAVVVLNPSSSGRCFTVQPSDLIMTSSNSSVFTIDGNGVIKPVFPGKATFTAKLKQNTNIYLKEDITINESLSKATITYNLDQTYTGKEIKPSITVKYGNKILKNGTDYTITYSNNKNVGRATMCIKGKGVFVGSVTRYFNIVSKSKTKSIASLKVTGISNKAYTGKRISQSITIKDGSQKLKNGTDYTVSYSNNINIGKATLVIKGKNKYTGTITKTFSITPKKITGFKVKSQTTNSITLSWSKSAGGVKYEIYSYNSSKKKWTSIGTTSKTSYTIKKLKAGTSYKYRVRAYKSVSKKKYTGAYTGTITTGTKPSTPKISSLSSKSKKVTLKWKKVSNATGYEIYMSTSKNGKYSKITTITKNKTVKYTKSSLKKKKKYYFKIRTYKTVNGKKIYSSYSSIKNIKVK